MPAQSDTATASDSAWGDVDFLSVVSVSAGEVVLLNSDGSETRLYSTSGDFTVHAGQVQGTVTSMARTDAGGVTQFEMIDGISVAASDLLAAGSSRFDLILSGLATTGFTDVTLSSGTAQSASLFLQGVATFDLLDFSAASAGVTADLWHIWNNVGTASGVTSAMTIDGLAGSAHDDMLAGTDAADVLLGKDGNDVLMGRAGGDLLDGGAGADTASYQGSVEGLTASLADPSLNSGDAEGDIFASIENLVGGAGNDTIVGDGLDNVLAGGAGDDVITTGAGNDSVVFTAGDGRDTITDFTVGDDGGHDSLVLLGAGEFSSFADLMAANRLQVVGGNVEILLGGNDQIVLQGVASVGSLSDANFRF